ncbi:MAG: 6-phosphogluconolactonase [bacterium]|nr:6-phosphogluconolactonase [bacterium]
MKEFLNIAVNEDIPFEVKKGIAVVSAKDSNQGREYAKTILYRICDGDTLLFLSGGSTPKSLYQEFAKDERLTIGAAALVDERFVKWGDSLSNEEMIRQTGLLGYFADQGIPFHGILNRGSSVQSLGAKDRGQTALDYEQLLKELLAKFKQKVAIQGIGPDGHTAGIAPNRKDFTDPVFEKGQQALLVSGFEDPKSMTEGGFGERITMTFKALGEMDVIIILAFGENKADALKAMFEKVDLENTPASFYILPEISQKTLLITDQKI